MAGSSVLVGLSQPVIDTEDDVLRIVADCNGAQVVVAFSMTRDVQDQLLRVADDIVFGDQCGYHDRAEAEAATQKTFMGVPVNGHTAIGGGHVRVPRAVPNTT